MAFSLLDSNGIVLGSVDSFGHLFVSKINANEEDADKSTYSVVPLDFGVGEGGWAGLCFDPIQWSVAAVARSFCKNIDVYDQDIHLRTLRTEALFAKLSISHGMNPYVFVFYRQAFASLALAPFAYFFDRKKCDPLSLNLLCKIFFVSLVGMESISITRRHGVAKVLGTIISLSEALIFVLIKGPPIYSVSKNQLISSPSTERVYTTEDWVKGSLTSISSNVVWSMWIIMQASIVKLYPALLRLTAIQTFFSCIQSGVWAIIAEKNLSTWKLGWDINLLPVAYCGFLFTAITCWLRIWVIENKGPVFLAMFTPLALINTAILSALICSEVLHLGSVGGGILLVGGLYWFLWGKHEETKANNANEDKQKPSTITTNKTEQ